MDRTTIFLRTTGREHVVIPFTILPQGTGAPLLGEGDPNGTYFTVTRTSAGLFSIATFIEFPAIVGLRADFMFNAPSGTWTAAWGAPTQSTTTNKWTIPLTVANSGTATDIAAHANNRIMCAIRIRNSALTP